MCLYKPHSQLTVNSVLTAIFRHVCTGQAASLCLLTSRTWGSMQKTSFPRRLTMILVKVVLKDQRDSLHFSRAVNGIHIFINNFFVSAS